MIGPLTALFLLALAAWQSPPTRGEAETLVIPASRQASAIAVLPVHGPIDGFTAASIRDRIKRAEAAGFDLVVLELDTPGGRLDATLEITRFLKNESPLPVAAWVRPQAFSAGTIIALACRDILVSRGSSLGDAAPVTGGPVGMIPIPVAERAKIESPLLADVVDSARQFRRDEKLAQSFVATRMALWELVRITDGARLFVDADEYRRVFGEAPPIERGRGAVPGSALDAPPPIGADVAADVESVQTRLAERPKLGPDDRADWRLVGQTVGDEELLVLGATEAVRIGFSDAELPDESALTTWYGASSIERLAEPWSLAIARFLSSWPVRVILIIVMIVGYFLEIATPGASVFGATALGALLLLVGAPMSAGLAEWWEALLIVAGLGLIAAEVFVIPGMGVAGIAGVGCLLVGLVGLFVTVSPSSDAFEGELMSGVVAVFAAMIASGVVAWMIGRSLPRTRAFGSLVLNAQLAPADSSPPSLPARATFAAPEPGARGVADSDLRPSGRVEIDGRVLNARAIGSWIARGDEVVVRSVELGEVIVEPNDDV